MTTAQMVLLVAAVLIAAPIAHRVVANYLRRRDHKPVPLVNADPYVTSGGDLPDFFSGQQWPVNPNRRRPS